MKYMVDRTIRHRVAISRSHPHLVTLLNQLRLFTSVLLLFLYFSAFGCITNTNAATIKIFDHKVPDHGLEVTIIPINDRDTCRSFFSQNIIGSGLIGFYMTITNSSDKVVYLLRDQVTYTNVLRERHTMLNPLNVMKLTETSSIFWTWAFGILGGAIAEAYNTKRAVGLSIMLSEVILSPNSSLEGALVFPFTGKRLMERKPLGSDFDFLDVPLVDRSIAPAGLSMLPIRGSTLTMAFARSDGQKFVISYTFGDTYRSEDIGRKPSPEPETLILDDLPKEMWPDW